MPSLLAVGACAALLLVPGVAGAPAASGAPARATHWMADVDAPHDAPTRMRVVVVPPAYATGPGRALDATREALDYWAWAIRQGEAAHPNLRFVSFDVRVLGADATAEDLRDARIVVTLDGAGAATDGSAWLGGAIRPDRATDPSSRRTERCVVANNGLAGFPPGGDEAILLRNFVLHEFGHCLASGHTGESAGLPHCASDGACYDDHPTDVMSRALANRRQCLSNLNLQALAVAYFWLTDPGAAWQPPPAETYLPKADYAEACMPDALRRF